MSSTISLHIGVEELLPPTFTQSVIVKSISVHEGDRISCEMMHISKSEEWKTKFIGDSLEVNSDSYVILAINPRNQHEKANVVIQLKDH